MIGIITLKWVLCEKSKINFEFLEILLLWYTLLQKIIIFYKIIIIKMNKKQRNRKLVLQNKRNRMINRRYISTIKTLSKLFTKKIKSLSTTSTEETSTLKQETKLIANKLYSIIDKAVKKGVLHKNNAARKKSKIGIISKINIR